MSACAVAVVVMGAAPAVAAPAGIAKAKKIPALAVKQSAKTIHVGSAVTYKPSVHLPAHDGITAWSITFGDGTKSVGKTKGFPHSVKHTYRKALRGKVTFTIKDKTKHTFKVVLPVTVTAVPVISVAPPLIVIPVVPAYVAPTGPLFGHVSGAGADLAGIPVSIEDESTGNTDAIAITDAHGNWAAPAGLAAPQGSFGYDVFANSDDAVPVPLPGRANAAYDSLEVDRVLPGGPSLEADLPAAALASGVVAPEAGSSLPPDTYVTAFANDSSDLFTFGVVDGSGNYSVALAPGHTWEVVARSVSTEEVATVSGPVDSTTPFTIPTIMLSTLPAPEAVVAHEVAAGASAKRLAASAGQVH
jgi:hypothetical protein